MIHSMERRISFSLGGLLMDPIPIKYIFVSPKAVGFAVKKKIFGEGADRIVREFREVHRHGIFVGPPMVGKKVTSILTTIEIKIIS